MRKDHKEPEIHWRKLHVHSKQERAGRTMPVIVIPHSENTFGSLC